MEPLATAGLTCSYGNITNLPSKLSRPTKFCKSFKTSSKADLLTMETNTPKATLSNFMNLETSGNLASPRKNNRLSPKSIKAKLNLSKGFVADRSTQLGKPSRQNKPANGITTDRLFIDDLSDSQMQFMGSQENGGYPNSSFTEQSRGHIPRDSSVESPLKEPAKIKLVDRSKSKFYRQKLSMVELHKPQTHEQTDKETPKQKNKHFVPGPRLDADGLLVEDKHRDYKLNNMFKMIEFLEKDQNLTSNRLELREKVREFNKNATNLTQVNPEDRIDYPELEGKYTIVKTLGEGSFAMVKLALDKNKNRVAIKIYSNSKIEAKNLKKNIQQEFNLLKNLDHKNIIKVMELIEGPRHTYVVMEYGGPVSLRDYLDTTEHSTLQEGEAALIFFELAKALVYLHSTHVYHRDLKLDNIMVGTAGQVKLVDFGLAITVKDNGLVNSYCGTPCYMAPEIYSRKKYHPDKSDVWSFGICIYRSVVGCFPFKGTHQLLGINESNLGHLVKKGDFEIPSHVSEELKVLIECLLAHCPSKRPSISEILKFDWFRKSPMLESTIDTNKNNVSSQIN